MTVHVIERIADDDRWMFACTCGVLLSANAHRAFELFDEHLAEDVTPDPLTELAIIEAKQRHPSRRGLVLDPQAETRARAYFAAREAERADVVAWIRGQKWTTRVLDRIADAIESGDHLGAADE